MQSGGDSHGFAETLEYLERTFFSARIDRRPANSTSKILINILMSLSRNSVGGCDEQERGLSLLTKLDNEINQNGCNFDLSKRSQCLLWIHSFCEDRSQ